MRFVIAMLAVLGAISGTPSVAADPPKLALLIGNSDYNQDGRNDTGDAISDQGGFERDLVNPVNDVADMSAKLRGLGFAVTPLRNATREQMLQALARFRAAIDKAGRNAIVIIYYSGHAIQVDGVNLIIPVGARLSAGYDFGTMDSATLQSVLAAATLPMNLLIEQLLDPDQGLNIVVLDACRNNAWDGMLRPARRGRPSGGLAATRGSGRGQAERQADLGGTLIAYSTQPGNEASDGLAGARNSPYTGALLQRIGQPGLNVLQMFNTVARDVQALTKNWDVPQRPWNNAVTLPDICLAGCGQGFVVTAPAPVVEPQMTLGDLAESQAVDLLTKARKSEQAGALSAARQQFVEACTTGSAEACREAGTYLDEGKGGRVDQYRALTYFEMGCYGADALACYGAGFANETGRGIPINLEKARTYMQRACDGGNALTNAVGCAGLAGMTAKGQGGPSDLIEARRLYEKSCTIGWGLGCNGLALLVANGLGGDRDPERAVKLNEKACLAGYKPGCSVR